MKALRFLIACILLCSIVPVAAQETMDATTLRQHIIMAEGKPPDSYVETTRVVSSSVGTATEREFHRGLDYREVDGYGELQYQGGRFEGRTWDQDANGLTTIHEPPSGSERPDALKVTVTRVKQPLDAWQYSSLNASGSGTIKYVDPQTFRVLREVTVTHSGNVTTDYSDFRTNAGYTVAFHASVDNEFNRTHSDLSIVSFETRAVTDAELAIPTSRPFVAFPPGVKEVQLPATFSTLKNTYVSSTGRVEQTEGTYVQHVLVRVMIGNQGLDLVLDSGAGGILIDRNVARELGLHMFAQRSGVTAARYDAASAIVPEMRVGDLVMRNVAVGAIPWAWDEQSGTKAVGLLGYDFIRSLGLTIDYPRRRVIAVPADSVTPPIMTPESDILPIRLGSHVPMVSASINNSVAEQMIVDTGWSSDMALFDFFSRRYPEAFAPRVAARLTGGQFYGVGGAFKSNAYRLANVDVGRYHFKQFTVAQVVSLESYQGSADGVIGSGILQHFAVTFDYAGGKMYLVHNEGQ